MAASQNKRFGTANTAEAEVNRENNARKQQERATFLHI